MHILGIETSCDETSAAIIEAHKGDNQVKLLSNIVSSSIPFHAKTGGIIPEIAAREQLKYILPVIDQTLKNVHISEIAAIAVTVGPGLIGSLLVGVETAKTLAWMWNKPIIPVNHLYGHIYANFISPLPAVARDNIIIFPALALIVSGGHTDLVFMKNCSTLQWVSGTRDDAAGEAFDKIGRLLGLPYPAGALIEKLAKTGNQKRFHFPRPLFYKDTLDFSFSGLKTAVLREVEELYKREGKPLSHQTICDLSCATQDAIIAVLVKKTLIAAKKYQVKSILLGGGVAANQTLVEQVKLSALRSALYAKIFFPQKFLCTDNAAMIAATAFFQNKEVPWKDITANPELYFD